MRDAAGRSGPVSRRASARAVLLALAMPFAFAGVVLSGPGPSAHAQDRGPAQRVLEGKVESKDGKPVAGAVVYLKNDRDQSVRSAIVNDDGSFRFVQLAQSTDYEVWARADNKRSKTKSISSFDTKNSFNFTLTID